MTIWNLINLMFVFVSGYFAMQCFRAGATFWGWFNVFASAMNAAAFATRI